MNPDCHQRQSGFFLCKLRLRKLNEQKKNRRIHIRRFVSLNFFRVR